MSETFAEMLQRTSLDLPAAVATLWAENDQLSATLAAATARAEAAEDRAVTWVPVTDRLPAPLLRVLACYNDGRMTIILRALHMPTKTFTCSEDFDDGEWDEETGNCYYPADWYEAVESGEYAFIGPLSGAVTHWAQLPQLPAVQS